MRIPHVFFAVINPTVRFLLRSPLHGFWSDSLMLITFTGRRSGRMYTTPVRYLRDGATIRCFTASTNKWWRNLRGGAEVTLRVGGRDMTCHAEAIAADPAAIEQGLGVFLSHFPQDAAYYDVRRDAQGKALPADVASASQRTVMVEARLA